MSTELFTLLCFVMQSFLTLHMCAECLYISVYILIAWMGPSGHTFETEYGSTFSSIMELKSIGHKRYMLCNYTIYVCMCGSHFPSQVVNHAIVLR